MAKTTHYNLNKPAVTDVGTVSELNENADIIDSELYSRVKSWNGISPDANGDVTATTIQLAQNLTSSYNVTKSEEFVIRTTSGASSVSDGNGTLEAILGGSVREGYEDPVIEMTFDPATREGDEDTPEVEIDKPTFLSHEPAGGTITVTYDTNAWTAVPAPTGGADPLAFYGLTVVGTPKTGDEITIEYTEAVLGTIVHSTPTSFVSTGWNLYNHQQTYARVAAYSDGQYSNRYKISGAKTSVKFSATRDGAKTALTVDAGGGFVVPSDGYVWVEGGNNTNTAIWATWGDWGNNYVGSFQEYTQAVIDISAIMSSYFEYGLMQVGSYRDEINLSTGQVYQRIERLENNSTNMETAKNSGMPYEYDDNYIYLVKSSVEPVGVTISNTYPMSDHGTEFFSDTTVGAVARTIYGENLKNKLERDVLTVSAQELSTKQKEQVLANIGAAPASISNDISNALNGLFKVKTYKYVMGSINAGSTLSVTATNLGITPITGYTMLAIKRFNPGNSNLLVISTNLVTNGAVATVKNTHSAAISGKTITLDIIWVKDAAL